jgi:hypothetical protein
MAIQKYARIVDGVVFETTPFDGDIGTIYNLDDPAQHWVACADEVEQGWTYNGTTFSAPVPPAPTPEQQYAAALAAGLQVTSTSTLSISATYALDQTTLNEIRALAVDCGAGLGFPGGASEFAYPDKNGNPVLFTEAQIKDVYRALRDRVLALSLALAGQGEWPASASVTIP